MTFEEQQPLKTAFNSSISVLERIHDSLKALNIITILRESETDKYNLIRRWKENWGCLLSLHKELSSFMKPEQAYQHQQAKEAIEKKYKIAIRELGTLNKNSSSKIDLTFVNDFDDWEIRLRRFAQEKGILMKDAEDEAMKALK